MKLKPSLLILPFIIFLSCSSKEDESKAIKSLLEKESATWRSGDSKGHADCWHIQPYSKILISTADGQTFDIPAENIVKPISNASGGTSKNTNYKMAIHDDNAWVSHDEVSIAKDGKKNFSHEIRLLEKINGDWKILSDFIFGYRLPARTTRGNWRCGLIVFGSRCNSHF